MTDITGAGHALEECARAQSTARPGAAGCLAPRRSA